MPGRTARGSVLSLELGASLEFGGWEFGAFSLGSPLLKTEMRPGINAPAFYRIAFSLFYRHLLAHVRREFQCPIRRAPGAHRTDSRRGTKARSATEQHPRLH